MRTISTITKAKKNYYSHDESLQKNSQAHYYVQGEKSTSLTQSRWFGQGAKKLGLDGEINEKDFKAVMDGNHPDTGQRLRGGAASGKERLAYDVTLSAPKSVSMALHIGGDMRVYAAHQAAVEATLKELECRYANARKRVGQGQRIVEGTGNLTIGKFQAVGLVSLALGLERLYASLFPGPT